MGEKLGSISKSIQPSLYQLHMNLLLTFIALHQLFVLTSGAIVNFTIVYKGKCPFNGPYQYCSLKGSTTILSSLIAADGTVTETVKVLPGALSVANVVIAGQNVTGNATYGIHSTHMTHVLYIQAFLISFVYDQDSGMNCFSISGSVTGDGVWKGSQGIISIAGCTLQDNPDFTTSVTVTTKIAVL